MKRVLSIILAMLFFSACTHSDLDTTTQQNHDSTESEWFENTAFDSVLPVYDGNTNSIFYVKNGLWCYDIAKNENTQLSDESLIKELYLYENALYFLVDYNSISKLDLDTGNKAIVWTADDHGDLPESDLIKSFTIYNDVIYLYDSGTSVLSYSLQSQETERFFKDVSSFAFVDDNVFFTDHAERTFTIYKRNINSTSDEADMFLGDGKTKESSDNTNMFDRLISINNELYYTKRVPAEIYKYNPGGEDMRIAEFAEDEDALIIEHKDSEGQLYYSPTQGEFCKNLYSFNPNSNKTEVVFSNSEFDSSKGFTVVNGILFFYTKNDSSLHCERIF